MSSPVVAEAYANSKSRIKGRLDGHYQHEGVKWMLQRELVAGDGPKGGILADDMGLGKTMQAIATMRGNECRTLIVTMVGTVNQWRDALIEFGGYKPVIINPSFLGHLPDDVDVAVTAYSSFQKAKVPQCLTSSNWHRIILDEGHIIRNPSTKVYKEIFKVKADIKWVLSGTPLQNSNKDVLALADWIGISRDLSLEDMIDMYLLRRTQEDQSAVNPRLALPRLTTNVVKLEFETKEESQFYDAVVNYYENTAETAIETLEAITRCRQACTNPVLFMDSLQKQKVKNRKRKQSMDEPSVRQFWPDEGKITSTKMRYLVDDIATHVEGKAKCLVFCMWTNEMKYLQAALKEKRVGALIYDGHLSREGKESVLYNFKNTSIPVLIIQITCGSCGLNLQCANKVYITSPNWNPCVELQAIGRAYRKGQTQQVTCVRLVMADTIEEKCMDIQERKMHIISEAMKDDSLVNRLGAFKDMDDIDIKDLLKNDRRKKRKQADDDDGDVKKEDDGAHQAQQNILVDPAGRDLPMEGLPSPVVFNSQDLDDFLKDIIGDISS